MDSNTNQNNGYNEGPQAGPDQGPQTYPDQVSQAYSNPEAKNAGSYRADPFAEYRNGGTPGGPKKKKHRGLIIFGIILAIFIVLIIAGAALFSATGLGGSDAPNEYGISEDHLTEISISGTISESGSSSIYEASTYDQEWVMSLIAESKASDSNKGIILYLDTPGGAVYETDEVYLALMDYKAETGRPVYAIMSHTCASGGYYISCAADKIYANRNTMTGSIGVTYGSMFDISELLSRYGVKVNTISSGANKSMGSMYEPMTDEQRAILQSMIDEAYDQFLSIVSEGRKMDKEALRPLCDGRLYSAQQAKDCGLIDEVCSREDAEAEIVKASDLSTDSIYYYEYTPDTSIYSKLLGMISALKTSSLGNDSDLSAAIRLAEGNSNQLCYMMEQ